MLPDGYVGLVVCDTRRALRWEAGLRRLGCDVVRVETRGAEADKGDWNVAVARADAGAARAYVAEVLAGHEDLPGAPLLSPSGWIALLAIGAVITALIVAGLVT